jgi:hypothetical protein
MSAYFDRLEHDLVSAAARRAGIAPVPARNHIRPWRGLLLATALCLTTGAATAGGTLYVLGGSVIPAPAARDVPPEQLPVAGSSRLTGVRATDPAPGVPAWTLRLARSRTGALCSTVGQLDAGLFGIVGMDGRFRTLPERGVDACGVERTNAASLVGVRVFDARRRADVRSLVYGVAGGGLRSVQLLAGGQERSLPVAPGGVFLAAVVGYPEDAGVRLEMHFADGHVERQPFGTSAFVVPDPGGLGAWRTDVVVSGVRPGEPPDTSVCVSFRPARQVRNGPLSPYICGDEHSNRHPTGWFFAARRLAHTPRPASFANGHWGRHPARTAVWGLAQEDIARVELLRPGVPPARLRLTPARAFLVVLPADVDPGSLRIRVTHSEGRVETRAGSAHLVKEAFP